MASIGRPETKCNHLENPMREALPATMLSQMNFLAGHWRGECKEKIIEEVWLAPNAGVALVS